MGLFRKCPKCGYEDADEKFKTWLNKFTMKELQELKRLEKKRGKDLEDFLRRMIRKYGGNM